jgi:uncharacterized protein (UPF0332 family)
MLKHKARSNLTAGEALSALGLTDAAANRYYYALYQAAVHALTVQGWSPGSLRSGALEWNHDLVMTNVYLVRRRRSDRLMFRQMRDLRTMADYQEKQVDTVDLALEIAAVRLFVDEVTK